MQNFVRIGKGILLFIIMIAIVDLCWLGYTYIVSVNAMEDTLSNIALMVAEENCLDAGSGNKDNPSADSKLAYAKNLIASNATAWLCYNTDRFGTVEENKNKDFGRSSRSANHTDIQTDDCRDLAVAASNIDVEHCLILGMTPGVIDDSLYSYVDCPQRGTPITVTLQADVNIHLLSFIKNFGNVSIPVKREITVIGMKFYKGKDA